MRVVHQASLRPRKLQYVRGKTGVHVTDAAWLRLLKSSPRLRSLELAGPGDNVAYGAVAARLHEFRGVRCVSLPNASLLTALVAPERLRHLTLNVSACSDNGDAGAQDLALCSRLRWLALRFAASSSAAQIDSFVTCAATLRKLSILQLRIAGTRAIPFDPAPIAKMPR